MDGAVEGDGREKRGKSSTAGGAGKNLRNPYSTTLDREDDCPKGMYRRQKGVNQLMDICEH